MRVGQALGRALHSRLGRQHCPRGEALTTAAVLAQAHDLSGSLDLRHHARELLGPARMPVDKPREVLARERRLLLRERVQRQVRVGCDLLAVALRNRPMLRYPLGRLAPLLPTRTGRSDLVLRLQLNALLFERAMVDTD